MEIWFKTKDHYEFIARAANLLGQHYSEEFEAAYKNYKNTSIELDTMSKQVADRDKSIEELEPVWEANQAAWAALMVFVTLYTPPEPEPEAELEPQPEPEPEAEPEPE
jgi:hypothetical protein